MAMSHHLQQHLFRRSAASGAASTPAKASRTDDPLQELYELIGKHFYKPDGQAIRIVLGAIQSHYLNLGDPAWLFLIGPPGSGKTTISILGAATLPQVQQIGDLTENTLLSGFYDSRTPGLLEKLGRTEQDGERYTTTGDGIFLMKDFTTVISMRQDKRSAILAQLREIHDGEFRRDFGTGQSKIWRGRISIIAAVTPAIDRQSSIFSTLGERFLQLRWSRPDSEVAGEWAINQQGQENSIRTKAQQIISSAFDSATKEPPQLTVQQTTRLAAVAEIAAIGRTHVYRDSSGSREIEHVPEPEANTRIAKGLAAIAKGLASLAGRTNVSEQDLQDSMRVGFDCMPATRRDLFQAVATGADPKQTGISRSVRERQLEELEALGLLEEPQALKPHSLSDKGRKLLRCAESNLLASLPRSVGGVPEEKKGTPVRSGATEEEA